MSVNSQVKHGNYHNYYNVRSDENRSDIFRQQFETLWNEIRNEYTEDSGTIYMLDIGCNRGNFTNKVHLTLEDVTKRKVQTIGIDIDEYLCAQGSSSYPNIEFIRGDVLQIATDNDTARDPIEQTITRLGIERFDVIGCFSVLMYIHLNGGDKGLRDVLDYLCSKGKLLVLELQAWKKYRDQERRLRRDGNDIYPLYEKLKWRGGEGQLEGFIKDYIEQKGFVLLSESAETNEFDRRLLFFKQK